MKNTTAPGSTFRIIMGILFFGSVVVAMSIYRSKIDSNGALHDILKDYEKDIFI